MDHLRAQQLISDALDKLPVESAELDEAKKHCRDCAECNAFVRTMLILQRHPLPEPPADLTERIIANARAQAAAAQADADAHPNRETVTAEDEAVAAAALGATGSFRAVGTQPDHAGAASPTLSQRLRDPRNRRSLVLWGTVAASVFVLAGFGAVLGARQILIPQAPVQYDIVGGTTYGEVPMGAPQSGAAESQDLSAQRSDKAVTMMPALITVSGTVYQYEGPAPTVDRSTLQEVGSTRTSLDKGGNPESYAVLGAGDPGRVYLDGDDGLIAFGRVSRSFEGRTYVLTGQELETYGQWPKLPTSIPAPTSPDGSPTFEPAGTDGAGITVYKEKLGKAENGIAIAPNPPAPDPTAGSPEWSWWEPTSQ